MERHSCVSITRDSNEKKNLTCLFSGLHYAEWTKDADCKNDGLQFHMSALRPSELGGPSGRMGSPYDSKLHNAYRLSNEQEDIRQFHVNLTITGTAKDQVVAEVSHRRNGDMLRLAKQTQQMDPGDSLILKGGLPKQLNITRMSNGCEYEFTFSKNTDAAYFHFSTRTIGYGEAKRKTPKPKYQELYCDKTTNSGKNAGTTIACTFPGW